MPIELGQMTLGELTKLSKQIERELKKREKKNIATAKKQLAALAKKHGLTLEDVLGSKADQKPRRKRRSKAGPKTKGIPKYRNPADPSQTWTGKGRPPAWIVEARASGVSEKKLLIRK